MSLNHAITYKKVLQFCYLQIKSKGTLEAKKVHTAMDAHPPHRQNKIHTDFTTEYIYAS